MMEEIKILRKKFNDVVHEMVKLEEQIDYLTELVKPRRLRVKEGIAHRKSELTRQEVGDLVKLACSAAGINSALVYSKTRKREYILVRQILMYLLLNNTGMSSSLIGKIFNKDHATVLHSANVITNEVEMFYKTNTDPQGTIETLKLISNVTHLPW